MGTLNSIIPQGPNRHCGNPEKHDRHSNVRLDDVADPKVFEYEGSWCDGIPPLEPFAELTIRVPLTRNVDGTGAIVVGDGSTYDLVVEILTDGDILSIFQAYFPLAKTSRVLRVRWGGRDEVYPLGNRGRVLREPTE